MAANRGCVAVKQPLAHMGKVDALAMLDDRFWWIQ
jgi:hypothetical protein